MMIMIIIIQTKIAIMQKSIFYNLKVADIFSSCRHHPSQASYKRFSFLAVHHLVYLACVTRPLFKLPNLHPASVASCPATLQDCEYTKEVALFLGARNTPQSFSTSVNIKESSPNMSGQAKYDSFLHTLYTTVEN